MEAVGAVDLAIVLLTTTESLQHFYLTLAQVGNLVVSDDHRLIPGGQVLANSGHNLVKDLGRFEVFDDSIVGIFESSQEGARSQRLSFQLLPGGVEGSINLFSHLLHILWINQSYMHKKVVITAC